MVKNTPANAGDARDAGRIPGLGRSPGGGYSNPLQCPCLENPMDRGAWQAIVHGVSKNQTQLKQFSTQCVSANPKLLIYLSPTFPFGNLSLFSVSMSIFLFCK